MPSPGSYVLDTHRFEMEIRHSAGIRLLQSPFVGTDFLVDGYFAWSSRDGQYNRDNAIFRV